MFALVLAGCTAARGPGAVPDVSVVDPLEIVGPSVAMPTASTTVFDLADGRIRLAGTGGQTVAFQIVLAPAPQAASVACEFQPLRMVQSAQAAPATTQPYQQITLETLRIYRVLNATVEMPDPVCARYSVGPAPPREYPDALVEVPAASPGAAELELSGDRTSVYRLELTLPSGLPAGSYVSQLLLGSGSDRTALAVSLESWGFDPPPSPVRIFAVLDLPDLLAVCEGGRVEPALALSRRSPELDTLLPLAADWVDLLSSHGLEVWPQGAFPKISGEKDNERIDWSGYAAVVESVLGASRERPTHWPLPVSLDFPPPARFGSYDSPSYRAFLKRYLDEFYEQFVIPGILPPPVAVFEWPDPRIVRGGQTDDYLALARTLAELRPDVTLVNPYVSSNLRPYGFAEFEPVRLDAASARIECPFAAWWDPLTMSALIAEGRQVWWRPGPSPAVSELTVTAPSYFVQALPWIADRYGAGGIVLTDIVRQPDQTNRDIVYTNARDSLNVLAYPGGWFGSPRPVPTMRLKMLRRGLQDLGCLQALRQAGHDDQARLLSRNLVRFAHTDALDGSLWSARTDGLCEDLRAWSLARTIAGLGLADRSRDSRPEIDVARPDLQTLIGQFRQLCEAVVLECEGVTAASVLDPETGHESIRWTYNMVLRNYTAGTVDGTLSFRDLPPGLTAVRDQVKVADLDWGYPLRVQLQAAGDVSSVGLSGCHVQDVVFKPAFGSEITCLCRNCAMVARTLSSPVRIDGRFDEWPDLAGASAADFWRAVPDGPAARQWSGADRRRVLWPTSAQVARDGRNLYLAIRCDQPGVALRRELSNRLDLAAGTPWGEDLVSVLLDPQNRRSFHPEDLRHVAIKANGAVMTTRGLPAGPVGGSKPWPADVRAAVQIFDDRWQIELAVPLDDLDAEGYLDRWWGFDLVRVSAGISELSSWSGAGVQLYKPVSLGNLFMPR